MADKPGEYLPPLVTKLKADISDLKAGFESAKKIQKEYRDDLGKLDEDFKKTKASAKGAGQEIGDFERLVRSKMRSGENATSAIRAEYDRLTESVKTLRKTMNSSGGAQRDKTYRELQEALSDLKALGSIAADFGIKLGDATGNALANGAQTGGPFIQAAVITALVGAALLAAPIMGATIAAALTLGIGGAVVGLAAYILKDDKKIKKAWEKLTETTSGVFERSAQSMKKPFIETLGWLNKEFKKLEKPLTKLFEAAGPLVQPLSEGLLGFLDKMLPGLTQALINAKPAFDSLGENMPKIGAAVGDFFAAVSADPEALTTVIQQLINLVVITLVLTSHLILGLTKVNDWMTKASLAVGGALTSVVNTLVGWWNASVKWIKELFKGLGEAIMMGMVQGIKWKATQLKDELVAAVKRMWEAANNFLQTGSPSKLMRKLGIWTVEGYAQGVDYSAPKAWAALAGIVDPRRASRGGGVAGYDAARAAASGSGGASLTIGAAPVVIQLDGRTIYEATIKYGQRGGMRNTTTGLGRVAGATA